MKKETKKETYVVFNDYFARRLLAKGYKVCNIILNKHDPEKKKIAFSFVNENNIEKTLKELNEIHKKELAGLIEVDDMKIDLTDIVVVYKVHNARMLLNMGYELKSIGVNLKDENSLVFYFNKKGDVPVFSYEVAKELIKKGYRVKDVKTNWRNEDSLVFYFNNYGNFMNDFLDMQREEKANSYSK